jgi:hypothetical protein
MRTIEHLRGIAALAPLRGRRPAVVVCADDAGPFEARREECPQARVGMRYDPGCAIT